MRESLNIMEQVHLDEEEKDRSRDGDKDGPSHQVEMKVASSQHRRNGLFKNMKQKYLRRVGDMFQVKFSAVHNHDIASGQAQAQEAAEDPVLATQYRASPYQNVESLQSSTNQHNPANLQSNQIHSSQSMTSGIILDGADNREAAAGSEQAAQQSTHGGVTLFDALTHSEEHNRQLSGLCGGGDDEDLELAGNREQREASQSIFGKSIEQNVNIKDFYDPSKNDASSFHDQSQISNFEVLQQNDQAEQTVETAHRILGQRAAGDQRH